MTIEYLDHININTKKLDECINFYGEIIGLENGFRPDIPIPGAWMYVGGRPVVHIMEMDGGRDGDTGPIDHVAFKCTGLADYKKRIEDAGMKWDHNVIAEMGVTQLYVDDPDGVKVELNFEEL
jgi:catechol 2,3-dioxygenase-like lactoylglutathione lyase family enzyme